MDESVSSSSSSSSEVKKSKNNRIWLVVGVMFITGLLLFGLFGRGSNQPSPSTQKEEKTYTITMSSGGNDVVGYDVILSYDPKMVTVGTVKSLDPQFQVVQSNAKEGMVAVTAIKLPSAQGSSVFENKAVLTIPVTQVKGQKDAVRIVQELENNTTKLINKDNQKVYLSDDMVRIAPNQ